jgi:EAL domain-containing protein (putative c-di-GMP-specific phosphodiesterase class I)
MLVEQPGEAPQVVSDLALRLQEAQLQSLDVFGIEFDLELRAGVACYPGDAASGEALLRCADLAISAGGRGVTRYGAAMGERVAYQVRLQRELARALTRGQLRLVMQPIVESRPPYRPLGLEALLRWRHPELGDVPPARFIPVAEESGLIVGIGGFVIEEACRLKAWLAAEGFGQLFVSLNVSPDQFRHGDLPARVSAALGRHGLDGAGMELEITESTLMEQTEHSAQQLQALAALGLGLSIDDFGTGWSSLAYLHRFPLTKLKVDRSFVSGLPQDHGAAAIVRSILTLARSLELSTLAEGVETEAQQALLSGLGCAQLQGFLHSRPLDVEDILPWLRARG